MDLLERLIPPCFGTCMMSLAFMALMLLGVYAYIEWCNEYERNERIKALKAEEEVKRVEELFDSLPSEVDTWIRKN